MATKNKKESIQIPQSRLDELLGEVTGELTAILKSEQEALSKGDGDGDEDDAAPSEESSGSESGAPVDDASAPPAPEATPPAPEASSPPEASAPAPEAAPEASGEGAPPSLEELVAAYQELPPEQLDLHLQAATMAAQASASAQPAPEASAPAAPPAPPAPAPEASAPPMMGKTEGVPAAKVVAASKGNGGMHKSEKDPEIELLKQQLELQKKEVETRDKALAELVEAMHQIPHRKAGTRISEIQPQLKPGERLAKKEGSIDVASLNREEAKKLLEARARDASLSKADRGLISDFYARRVGMEQIGHLLASAK